MVALGGESVIYTPTVGSPPPAPVTITGIFDSRYDLAEGGAQAGAETLAPAVFFRASDLPTDLQVDEPELTIRAIVYRIVERRPDDMGGIVLVLRAVA